MELPGFPDEPHEHDHGDDYGEVLLQYLQGLVNHGWIDDWALWSDTDSIVLHRKEWGSGFVMGYCDALEYARGFSDAGHLLTLTTPDAAACILCHPH